MASQSAFSDDFDVSTIAAAAHGGGGQRMPAIHIACEGPIAQNTK